MAARRQALRLAARALEQRLNADTSDHAGPELACSRGEPARYRGRHEKTFESVLGPLRLERAYYHCPGCQAGFCPRDRALRLELYSLTPGVLRMTGSTAALVSFEESSALLHELAGVEVSVSQVQRAAEALGAEIAGDERVCVERMGEVAPTMYLGMDGTGVPMRPSEVAGRSGKQMDGSAKTREAKVVAVWSTESRDEEGRPMRDPDRSLIQPPLKAPPFLTPASNDPTSPSVCCGKPRGEASPRRPDTRCWAMVRSGSGIPLRNCFPRPFRSWIDSTSKRLSIELPNRSSAQPPRLNHGPKHAAPSWMTENCAPSSTSFAPMIPAPRRSNARCISSAIAPACATRSFTPWDCVLQPASWRPVAK